MHSSSARVAQSCTTTTDRHFGPVVMVSKSVLPFLALAVGDHKPEGFFNIGNLLGLAFRSCVT